MTRRILLQQIDLYETLVEELVRLSTKQKDCKQRAVAYARIIRRSIIPQEGRIRVRSALETTYELLLSVRKGRNKLSSTDKSEFLGALESLHVQDTKDLFKRLEDGKHTIDPADDAD